MKLVASLVVHNEYDRYLDLCVEHLLTYCDAIAVLDDASDDGTEEYLASLSDRGATIRYSRNERSTFYEHEGRTRQRLLDLTLALGPTHILAIDADEFVAEPALVRHVCQLTAPVWTLEMEEVWELDGDCLCVREDGGWASHPVPILWAVESLMRADDPQWRIADKALACGRVPVAVARAHRPPSSGTEVLHFGWAREAERERRHWRYAVADGGRFHRSAHLDSILWPPDHVQLRGREWPPALETLRGELGVRVTRPDAAALS